MKTKLLLIIGMAVSLFGYGYSDIVVSPSEYDYGIVNIGLTSSETFSVTNNGGSTVIINSVDKIGADSGHFTITDNGGAPFSLNPGESNDITARFNPTDSGLKSITMRLTTDDPSQSDVDVTLQGTGRAISVSPASPYNYGTVDVGSDVSQTFTVTNNGTTTTNVLSVIKIGADGEHFTITDDGGAPFPLVASGGSNTITARFNPTEAGFKSITMRLTTDHPIESNVDVVLQGTGIGPEIDVNPASPYNYGSVTVGLTANNDFSVMNNGSGNLDVTSVTLTGGVDVGEFTITDDAGGSFTVTPSSSETITVQFNPTSYGAKSANLQIISNDPDEGVFIVTLTGTGSAPDIDVNPPSYNYGSVTVGSTSSQFFTISNYGNDDLDVSSVTLTGGVDVGEFTITDNAGGSFTVAPLGGSETVTVRFNPTSTGAKSANLQINSNDPDEGVKSVPLSGNGTVDVPNTPILVSPSDGATGVSINPKLQWNDGGGGTPDYYKIEVRDESYDLFTGSSSNEWKDIGPLTPNMSYTWRVQAINTFGSSPWSDTWTFTTAPDTDVGKVEEELPQVFALHPNYPNPFNSGTTIRFDLEKAGFVELKILDIQGKEITSLISEFKEGGSYQYIWNAKDIPSGIYLYRLQTDSHIETKKLILQK